MFDLRIASAELAQHLEDKLNGKGVSVSVISDAAIGQGGGASDRVQIAIIGCGGRGAQVTSSLVRQGNVLCSQVWDIRESGLSVLLII